MEAIRLVKQLEAEKRNATAEEQAILSKYVGWGGLANAFNQRDSKWASEYEELKSLLTPEEYAAARGSTLNAHYTDISVIKAMYDGLEKLGFQGGRMLEPACGVGNFVGAMPARMSQKVKSWTMVELDSITGMIAKHLYPQSDVRIQGFEKANIVDNIMDAAVSNVPFGNYGVVDRNYPKKITSSIHNYFIAKSIDKVRPGGVVMVITSSYTMDSSDSSIRKYLMQKADLLGAIRLPNSAFKGNAGTEVVTDILVLRKREAGTEYAGVDFLDAPYTRPVEGLWNGAYINSYFTAHPEMVLGTPTFNSGMYRSGNLTYNALEGKGSLSDQIREAFDHIAEVGQMTYPEKLSPEKTNLKVERQTKKPRKGSVTVENGKVFQQNNGEKVEIKVTNGAAERISGMLGIRDIARNLLNYQQQGLQGIEIQQARKKLNDAYDTFVAKYGFLNAPSNRNAIKVDPDYFSILALENWNPDTKKAEKSDLFFKDTVTPNKTVTSAANVSDGLIVSVNQTGGVDVELIARLTGKTEQEVTRELIDGRKAFKTVNGGLETAERYLSGNVRAKLREAEAMAPIDKDFRNNVEALKAVVPADISYSDIYVNPGTPWIPGSVYSDFAAEMLGGSNAYRQDVDISRNADTGNFTIDLNNASLKYRANNTQKWGTKRRSFLELLDAMMNSKSVVIKNKLADGSVEVDQDATAAANEKMEEIKKEFQEWLWRDEGRRQELERLYNETFNAVVTPTYNGDNLTVNGMRAGFALRSHQANAVQRIISSGGNTLLAHKVGAGKTLEMAAAAMKLRELGVIKKPMFAVPKSLVAQWGAEFQKFFPAAKLLVAESGDFTADNRKIFANRIANNDYDAVIVSYEQFEKLPISDSFALELYQEQIDSVIAAIEEAKAEKGGRASSVKDLEKKRKSLQVKIDKLTDTAKDTDSISFENLGIDSLFIDEAHNFKNLFYTTSMTNISGLGNKDGSKRAFDLYTKVRYLQKMNGGKGIVFATATPVMNSMSEMYIMQQYLQPELLKQLGITTFDAWAKQFGEVVNGVEIKPSGQGYRVKQSFSRFKNLGELQLLFRNFADVMTKVPGLKIPKMKGGGVHTVVCEPGQFQKDYMRQLTERADNVKNVDPSVDNMLKITSDGRKISYTQRMIDPTLPYEAGCKINRCIENVAKVYKESGKVRGTQMVFCDMATPKGKSNTENDTASMDTDSESARLYDDIKAGLVKKGIPAKEIAFIHDAYTDAKKKKLQEDVNSGKIRVLIGSTGKMGVGLNAQERIVAIHHLDAPWRPGDVEQRNGRAYRQGNINEEVECFTYVTEGSFDARLWDILERKQNFIDQVMNGENVGRDAEDTGEVTLSAAEVKALASGSPLILEQVQLGTDIKKLESLHRSYVLSKQEAQRKQVSLRGQIQTTELMIANGRKDLASRTNAYQEDHFSMVIDGKTFTDKKSAGVSLLNTAIAKANEDSYTRIGNFAGFQIEVIKTNEGILGVLRGENSYQFKTYVDNTTRMVTRMMGLVEDISKQISTWEQNLKEYREEIVAQKAIIEAPFAKQSELEQKRNRYNAIMEELNPKQEQRITEDSDMEQHQERTRTLTDREVLSFAADNIHVDTLTDAERDALRIFKERLSKLDELHEKRKQLGRTYREQQFGKSVDRKAAAETLRKMDALDTQIQETEGKVLNAETAPALRAVLPRARNVVETAQQEKDAEILKRWRDRRNNAAAIKKYRERIASDVKTMSDWIISPSNKQDLKHVPDALKDTVIPFLTSIDFSSKRQLRGGDATKMDAVFLERIKKLQAVLRNQQENDGQYSGYNDLPPDFMERLSGFQQAAEAIVRQGNGQYVINQMTSQELQELAKIVKTLKQHIQNFNRFHANAVYQHVYEAGDSTIQDLRQYKDGKSRWALTEFMNDFVFWQQIRPAYAFERFGAGGKAIYDGLRRGEAQRSFDADRIRKFADQAYTAEEVRSWEKETHTIELEGRTVKATTAQIMSFYELLKRKQAQGHIFGVGVRFSSFRNSKEGKISDVGGRITLEDAQKIIGVLTPRQIEVADSLQRFMQEVGGEWGNYVTMKRFGENLFGEENYFPINSDGRHLEAEAGEKAEAASLYALLNMGFTKKTQEKANNRLIVYSIFDVFGNHMASMSQYHAMALPVLDALKWFNYQQKEDRVVTENGEERVIREVTGSVRDEISRVYGAPDETGSGSGKRGYGEKFITNILKSYNGTGEKSSAYESIGLSSLRRYNMSKVAYNFRVVIQQPMAITRAAMILKYEDIMRGLAMTPKTLRENIDEMHKYSGIALWKDLGFYDVNISRGLADMIKHKETFQDKVADVGMWGAEKADQITWAAMWNASKIEVQRKYGIQPGMEGYWEAVTSLFDDVIYKTQVVDSVLTKNEYLRSKNYFARATGSFMSESTATFSMLADAVDKYRMDLQKGMTFGQALKNNGQNIARRSYVFAVGSILMAAVQAVSDAFRDDDKYEKWGDRWLDAFLDNLQDELNPLTKLPVLDELVDIWKEFAQINGADTYGYGGQSILYQWRDAAMKAAQIFHDKTTGESTNYTWYGAVYNALDAASSISGLPIAPLVREGVVAWNSVARNSFPSLMVRTYEQSPKTEIKYTYQDGKMSKDEAIAALVRDAGMEYSEAASYVEILDFRKDNPEYSDEGEASISRYMEYCESSGMDAKVFFEAYQVFKDTSADKDENGKTISGSKRAKIVDYIDSLNLTADQKDALYFAFDYKESTLDDTPWH